MTDRKQRLAALADEVLAGEGLDNSLDVRIEVALFRPCKAWKAIRANDAGTKIITSTHDGRDITHWAPEWTAIRGEAAAELRAQSETVA